MLLLATGTFQKQIKLLAQLIWAQKGKAFLHKTRKIIISEACPDGKDKCFLKEKN